VPSRSSVTLSSNFSLTENWHAFIHQGFDLEVFLKFVVLIAIFFAYFSFTCLNCFYRYISQLAVNWSQRVNGYENPIRLIVSVGSPALCDIPCFKKKKRILVANRISLNFLKI
jgi:hypothetical protein